jgi:hypothetical protein
MRPLFQYLKRDIALWVGVIFVVAGAGATVAGIVEWRAARTFERDAIAARATVVAKTIESANRESETSTRYLVTYAFAAANGAAVEQTEEVSVDAWETLEEGSEVAIRYLPSDPSTARSRPSEPAWIPPFMAMFPVLFVAIGVLVARPGVARARVVYRVATRGVTTQATVVDVAPTNVRINRVTQWRIGYEFRNRSGRTLRGESDLLAPQSAQAWSLGDHGTVRYDPDRPEDSVWLGET